MKRVFPLALAIFLFGIVSYAISRLDQPSVRPTETAVQAGASESPPSAEAAREDSPLAQLDVRIAAYRARAEARDDDWLDWEFVAIYAIDRARITGSFEDWAVADRAVESAFAVAIPGTGPFLTRANLNGSMHRIDRVEPDLQMAERSVLMSRADRLAILSMRADARYYGGDYVAARELYEEQLTRTQREPTALVAAAQLAWHTGDVASATRWLDEAAQHPDCAASPALLAWILSARALFERDRGQLDEARNVIERARGLQPEDAHLDQIAAEIAELRGDDDEALHLFRQVAARTSSPQAMDGAARILRARGDEIAARELVETARQSYDAQLALFPEAAAGHAIDHWLRLERDDVDRMIEIAELNAEARPYGEPRIKLAMAYLLAGRVADARAVIDAVRGTEWRTPELFVVDALTQRREGLPEDAAATEAESSAPGAIERHRWLAGEGAAP